MWVVGRKATGKETTAKVKTHVSGYYYYLGEIGRGGMIELVWLRIGSSGWLL
jgi:hypothetical protein